MGSLVIRAILILAILAPVSEQRICRYTLTRKNNSSNENGNASDNGDSESLVQGSNQTCSKETNHCFALWREDSRNNSKTRITILGQGCWQSSDSYDCENSRCIANTQPSEALKSLKDTYYCCCKENFCNEHVSHEEVISVSEVTPTEAEVVSYAKETYLLIVIILVLLLVIVIAIILMRKDFKRNSLPIVKVNQDSLHLMESGIPYSSNFAVENLSLEGILGQGRYGAVWKGFTGDQQVAVKIFPAHHKHYFYNEVDIYSLPFMTHPSILDFLGCDERTNLDGNTEYFLYLSLVPNGNLQDYLTANTVDWETFCKMALSISEGLAFLHTDIQKGDKLKPCIAHRDLNTKNILVKEDLSCVICDLGFATKTSGSKYYYNGEERRAETRSINDKMPSIFQVGTLRYMSPEVLEGAVNLRDCETSLKQIDIYALGLILWELSTRCSDFYPTGMECGPYKQPFEVEIGHPTFEQMQIMVCRHKARPLFPDLWRDTPAIRSVKETVEDCWDQDAEARLTALCVEERFHELCELNERQKSSLLPSAVNPFHRTSLVQRDSQNILLTDNKEGDSCMSESTVETLLTTSPTNLQINCKNSNQFNAPFPSVQPYQGRNPCLERNLMLPEDSESNSCELIDKSQKHVSKKLEPSVLVNEYLNLYAENPPQITSNSHSNTNSEPVPRSVPPIPFLQNVNAERSSNVPKLSNLPKPAPHSKKVTWRNLMKIFENKQKESDVGPQIDCNANSSLIVNESGDNLTTPTASMEVSLNRGKMETKVVRCEADQMKKPLKSSTDCSLDKENQAVQSAKRPNTLDLPRKFDNGQYSPLNNTEKSKRIQSPLKSGKRCSLNVNPLIRKEPRAYRAKSLSGIEDLEKEALLNDEGEDAARKEKKHSLEELFSSENSQLKDPNLRIKTPGDVPSAVRRMRSERNTVRFSLYDDRIMSGHYDETLYSYTYPQRKNGNKFLNSLENIKFSQNI